MTLLFIAFLQSAVGQTPPAASVALVPAFSLEAFRQPDSALWPGYFWLWNAPLDPDTLRAQLKDMAAHDARSVCVLPMPHGFRPDSTNNSLEPDYLTPGYLEMVHSAVGEAARLGMTWWLYDEGGWPSGQALGKVVEGHPELTRRGVAREPVPANAPYTVPADALALVTEGDTPKVFKPGSVWAPSTATETAYLYRVAQSGGVDLLNPDATARFISLTHAAYASVLAEYFGKTVRFTFTDEPVAGMPNSPKYIPWFSGIDRDYQDRSGRAFLQDMPRFYAEASSELPIETARARVALYDTVSQRFSDSYFAKLKDWGRKNGLASGGHLGGDDETFGAVKYGYGHLLRQLRQFDVPGVDLIWRQLFPGKEAQSNFPVAAASAAHQNGTRFAFSESFCVYGNGLTPAQMKWLVDYQYIRGVNLLVIGCYPMSTRDHHMTGERPHFGPMNPLWDHLDGFHGYVARLGYALSVGRPAVRTALYYPARDMWAWGGAAKDAVETYEALERELLARQCPFDLVDDDLLSSSRVEGKELVAGAMRYDTVLCGDVKWMAPAALKTLNAFAQAGGRALSANHAVASDGVASTTGESVQDVAGKVSSSVELSPASRDIRVAVRQTENARIVVLFNEGQAVYNGSMGAGVENALELDLMSGKATRAALKSARIPLTLDAGATRTFVLSPAPLTGDGPALVFGESITIAENQIHAVTRKQTVVGEHDFEIKPREVQDVPFAVSSVWKSWIGEDFSGEVEYQFDFEVPASWAGSAWTLQTGAIEYAATAYLDDIKVGELLWAPWRIALPACSAGKHRISIRVANTLANELTSDRVTKVWDQKSGPGWPSPYHKRALVFERESRGGGMSGPIRLTRLSPP